MELLHKDDGPALIYKNGKQEWYMNGVFHRNDGPAVIYPPPRGRLCWYNNGRLHRTDGPAIVDNYGYKAWWINGKRHRDNGPAVIRAYSKQEWWVNGTLHRTDGPAIIWPDGSEFGTNEWYINGKNITNEVSQWLKFKRYGWNKKRPWTQDRVFEFMLTFS